VLGLEVPEDLKEQVANAVQREEVTVVNSTVLHRQQRSLALVTGNRYGINKGHAVDKSEKGIEELPLRSRGHDSK
jgi:hypothetical protein